MLRAAAVAILRTLRSRGGARNLFFSLLGGANHTNLYKKLIKIQMFNVNLGTIGGSAWDSWTSL